MNNNNPTPTSIKLIQAYFVFLVLLPAIHLLILWFAPNTYHLITIPQTVASLETARTGMRFLVFLLSIFLWIRVRRPASRLAIRAVLVAHIFVTGFVGYLALTTPPPQTGLLADSSREPLFAYSVFLEATLSLLVLMIVNGVGSVKEYYGASPSHNSS